MAPRGVDPTAERRSLGATPRVVELREPFVRLVGHGACRVERAPVAGGSHPRAQDPHAVIDDVVGVADRRRERLVDRRLDFGDATGGRLVGRGEEQELGAPRVGGDEGSRGTALEEGRPGDIAGLGRADRCPREQLERAFAILVGRVVAGEMDGVGESRHPLCDRKQD